MSSRLPESKPASTLTLSFSVTNGTSQEEEFIENLEVPAEWRVINPATTIALGAQQTKARILAILIPANASAGEYDIAYSVQSQRDSGIRDFDTVRVNVLSVSMLTFLVEARPGTVIAGDKYQVVLRLLNQGNSESRVLIAIRSTEESTVRFEPDKIALQAGASQIIAVNVKTREKTSRQVKDSLLVEARYAGAKDGVAAGTTVSVDIRPRRTSEDDAFHRIPGGISRYVAGDQSETAMHAAFFGAGSLDESGKNNVDFLVRGPDTEAVSGFGERDQQYLNYRSENFDLRIGDESYSLSRLTDYYRYGRGLAVDIRQPHGANFGAFFVRQRWGSPDEHETGVYLRKRLSESFDLRFNALDRGTSDPAGYSGKLCSIEANVKPARATNLLLEYADCGSNRNEEGGDKAYAARLDGGSHGAYYSLERVYAGPNYYGYYRDLDYTNGAASLSLSPRLRGHASGQTWKQNLKHDEARGASPVETRSQLGLSYALRSRLNLSLDHDWFCRHDQQLPPTADYSERSLRFGAGKSFGNSSIQTYLEIGKQDDFLAGSKDRTSRYSVYYSLKPSTRQYYSVYAHLGDYLTSETRLLGGNNSVGFHGSWKLTDMLTWTLLYGIDQPSASGRPDIRQLYSTATYELATGESVALRFRHVAGVSGGSQTSFLLSYEKPWGLPVARKRNTGAIKGRVYDTEKPGKPGIARAVVTANGAATVTDKNGDFVFKHLVAGTYSLAVERNSIGLDRITAERLPTAIEVRSKESTEVQIPVARAAALVGNVAIWSRQASGNNGNAKEASRLNGSIVIEGAEAESLAINSDDRRGAGPNTTGLTEGPGLSSILLELSKDPSEVVRTLTNEKGRFSFDDLAPGKYRLTVYGHNLPAFHELEDAQWNWNLTPGAKERIALRVIPRLRPVKIIEQGQLLSSVAGAP